MNDVRKALIWGIENPPREYTIEEWFIIAEFARYVAEHSKESLKQEVIEKLKQSKPCVTIDTESEDNMKKEYEQLQRGMKEFAKGKIGRSGEVPPSINIEDIRPIKDDRVAEVKIKFKCPDCKYMANDSGEEPCCDCHDSDKYEENDLWGGEGD